MQKSIEIPYPLQFIRHIDLQCIQLLRFAHTKIQKTNNQSVEIPLYINAIEVLSSAEIRTQDLLFPKQRR